MAMAFLKNIGRALLGRRNAWWTATHQYGSDLPASRVMPQEALRCPPVAVAVRVIAQSIGALDWRAEGERATMALKVPNDIHTKTTFMSALVRNILLHGSAPVVRRSPAGEASMRYRLAPLDPETVTHAEGANAMDARWLVDGQPIGESDSIRVLFDGGSHDFAVQSRVAACSDSIRILNACNRRIYNHALNGAEGKVIVNHQGKNEQALADEQKRLVKRLAPQRSDEERADYDARTYGGVLVMGGGSAVTTVPAVSPADQELLGLRESTLREISASFGLPPFSAGGSGDTKYNNVQARQAVFLGETAKPLVAIITEGLSLLLDAEVSCDVNGVPPDLASKISAAVQAAGGAIMTPSQAGALVLDGYEAPDGAEALRSVELSDAQANAQPDRRGENQGTESE